MARNRLHLSKCCFISLLALGGAELFAEKIQFDIPTEREEQPIAVQQRSRKPEGVSRDSARPVPAPNMRPAIPVTPQPMEKISKEELEKRRNWLSNDSANSSQTAEEAFKVTGFTTETKEQEPTFLGNALEEKRDPLTLSPREKAQMESAYDRANRPNLFSPPATEQRGLWDTGVQARQTGTFSHGNNFSDFWGEKLNSLSAINENPLRRSQISELLERRPAAEPINSFLDNSRQPLNPVEGVGATAFERNVPQSSFTDQWKGDMTPQANLRQNTFEDLKPKIATPLAPRVEVAPPASTWTKPKSGVLPFPKRPGEIF